MTNIIYKSYSSTNNSFDENERSVVSFISTISPDRYGEIVMPEGVDTKNYEKNPVVLLNHTSPLPIGKNLWIKKEATGIKAKTQFADTIVGNDLMKLYKDGFMRAFSIGFIPKVVDTDNEKRIVHKESELLEYSAVTIPANQDALMLSYKSVQSMELKEILEREVKEIQIYEKLEDMKLEFFKALDEHEQKIAKILEDLNVTSDIQEKLKEFTKISELEDKFNQLSETMNQFQLKEKRIVYQRQFEKELLKEALEKIHNQI